jgi:hypothetical protein
MLKSHEKVSLCNAKKLRATVLNMALGLKIEQETHSYAFNFVLLFLLLYCHILKHYEQ